MNRAANSPLNRIHRWLFIAITNQKSTLQKNSHFLLIRKIENSKIRTLLTISSYFKVPNNYFPQLSVRKDGTGSPAVLYKYPAVTGKLQKP